MARSVSAAGPRHTQVMTSSAAAELSVIGEHLARYRERAAAIARTLSAGARDDNGDVVAALFEAERALRTAERAIDRSTRLLEG